MLCKYCGKEIDDDSNFCKHCGKCVKMVNGASQETQKPLLSTIVTTNDILDCETDDGVLYSWRGKRLLKCEDRELREYTVKAGTEVICDLAFGSISRDNYYNLTSIVLPVGVKVIGKRAFYNCKNLESIRLPDSVTSIGNWAFSGCYNLSAIKLPEGLTEIGNGAFERCENLTAIELPDSVTSIGDRAFEDCDNLTSIKLPSTLTSIESEAFCGCSSLTSITLPEGITHLSEDAFGSGRYLKKIYIDCADIATVTIALKKFRFFLPVELHDRIAIADSPQFQKLFPTLPLFKK